MKKKINNNNNNNNGTIQAGVDINKIVLDAFKHEFPGAPENEIAELIVDIGQTILIESMAKIVDEVEAKDKDLAQEVKDLFSQKEPTDIQAVKRISEICLMPRININLDEIYRSVAVDVVKDVLGK
jgi:hypothetical protein